MPETRKSVTDGAMGKVPVRVTAALARSCVAFRRAVLKKRAKEKPRPDLAGGAVTWRATATAATKATTIRTSRLPMD